MFKKFIKRYWLILAFALLINVPIVLLGAIRTNKEVDLTGDTQNINGFINIDNEYIEEGSFSSIYIIAFEHSTILQNIITSNIKTAEVTDLNLEYNQLSDLENYEAGQIQKNSAIQKAIIVAYEKAMELNSNISISYEYKGLEITYYSQKSALRVGDFITKINDISISVGAIQFKEALIEALNNDTIDKFTILRNNKEIIFNEEEIDYNNFGCYEIFDIDYNNMNPTCSIKSTVVGGPSGGLLQTLSIYNKLTEFDYTRGLKIAGTGTMSLNGKVGAIGGIKQKIYTAFKDNVDVFFCPSSNYDEALIAYNSLENKEKMALVKVEYLSEAIKYLEALNV